MLLAGSGHCPSRDRRSKIPIHLLRYQEDCTMKQPIIGTCYAVILALLSQAVIAAKPNIVVVATGGTIAGRHHNDVRFGGDYRLRQQRSEEHTSELQSRPHLVCRLLLEKKK